MIKTSPFSSIITLSGFKSPWAKPNECKCITCETKLFIISSLRLCIAKGFKCSPSIHSLTTYKALSRDVTPTSTILGIKLNARLCNFSTRSRKYNARSPSPAVISDGLILFHTFTKPCSAI